MDTRQNTELDVLDLFYLDGKQEQPEIKFHRTPSLEHFTIEILADTDEEITVKHSESKQHLIITTKWQSAEQKIVLNPDNFTPPPPKEPIKSFLKDLAYNFALTVATIPGAINAFCAPSKTKPANLSKELWNSFPPDIQAQSIINLLSSIAVNVYVLRDSFPNALDKLKTNFQHPNLTAKKLIANISFLLTGIDAALPFAATSYEACKWITEAIAIVAGLLSFVQTCVTRYPAVINGVRRVELLFDKDMRAQRKMANQLRYLTQGFINNFNQMCTEHPGPVTAPHISTLLKSFGERNVHLPSTDFFRKRTTRDHLRVYALAPAQEGSAILIAAIAFYVFTKKGFDGLNVIFYLGGSSLDHLDNSQKFALGSVGGAVSGTLYYLSTHNFFNNVVPILLELLQDFISALIQLCQHPINTLKDTYQHPEKFGRFLKLSAGVAFSVCSSQMMVTVGRPLLGDELAQVLGFGALEVNLNGVFNQILKEEKTAANRAASLSKVINYLEENPLPKADIQHLGRYSVFAQPLEKPASMRQRISRCPSMCSIQ